MHESDDAVDVDPDPNNKKEKKGPKYVHRNDQDHDDPEEKDVSELKPTMKQSFGKNRKKLTSDPREIMKNI